MKFLLLLATLNLAACGSVPETVPAPAAVAHQGPELRPVFENLTTAADYQLDQQEGRQK